VNRHRPSPSRSGRRPDPSHPRRERTPGASGGLVRQLCLTAPALTSSAQGQTAGRAILGVDVHELANGVLGIMSYTVARDVTTSSLAINSAKGDLSFLDGRSLEARGLGGALRFDYEKFAPGADDDLEIRCTNLTLRSHGDTPGGGVGHAKAESASVWASRRVPVGWGLTWDRPVRYFCEAAVTDFPAGPRGKSA
jgi:hypothetical protein